MLIIGAFLVGVWFGVLVASIDRPTVAGRPMLGEPVEPTVAEQNFSAELIDALISLGYNRTDATNRAASATGTTLSEQLASCLK